MKVRPNGLPYSRPLSLRVTQTIIVHPHPTYNSHRVSKTTLLSPAVDATYYLRTLLSRE